MKINNPKYWNEEALEGEYLVTYKIDGVRCIKENGEANSKHGKPLYNVPGHLLDGDYETFLGNWEASMSATRTHDGEPIPLNCFYSIDPLDPRLNTGKVLVDPTKEQIEEELREAVSLGYEGLVLRKGSKWIKVVTTETYDTAIIGMKEGTGKNKGSLGSIITAMGNVGTGFFEKLWKDLTDKERVKRGEEGYQETSCNEKVRSFLWMLKDQMNGVVIEVDCKGLTPGGKFRHPRFKRLRWDK